ncbi:MAG: hypothetical protein K6U77_10935 [Armatimonadetes bacterium]|nr:hypothetical protein [Armatimonadota bacterium]
MKQDTAMIDELVRQAETIIQDCFAASGRGDGGSTGRTQLSNAIDAINQSGSINVFRNWLRYQTAREDFWRTRGSKGTLAEQIDKYVQKLQSDHRDHPEEAVRYLTYFLGFMRRTLIALRYLDQIPTEFKEDS